VTESQAEKGGRWPRAQPKETSVDLETEPEEGSAQGRKPEGALR
jgi:hypothetical protein